MYVVTVLENGRKVGSRRFEYGEWQQIGYWLDDQGFIDPRYTATVEFEQGEVARTPEA